MQEVRIAIQEHLGTGMYKGDFDTLINRAKKRLGPGGFFTITSTGDDRLPSDRRYESFVDKLSKKYCKHDLGGRATYVEGADITVLNSLEMEIEEGHLLAVGLPRDINLDTGSEVPFMSAIEQVNYYGAMNLIGHPFFSSGALGHLLQKALERGDLDYFQKIDGIAVYTGVANLSPGANEKARQFFRELIEPNFPHIAPHLEDDGHSKWLEFARVTTKIPEVTMNAGETIKELRKSFRYLASQGSDKVIANNRPSPVKKAIGFVGAVRHGLDLKLIHPHRLKKKEKN